MSAVQSSSYKASMPASSSSSKTSESELASKDVVTPDDVLAMDRVTEGYLCSPAANVYNIDFTRFKIRDMATSEVLFEIAKPPGQQQPPQPAEGDKPADPNVGRFVR